MLFYQIHFIIIFPLLYYLNIPYNHLKKRYRYKHNEKLTIIVSISIFLEINLPIKFPFS